MPRKSTMRSNRNKRLTIKRGGSFITTLFRKKKTNNDIIEDIVDFKLFVKNNTQYIIRQETAYTLEQILNDPLTHTTNDKIINKLVTDFQKILKKILTISFVVTRNSLEKQLIIALIPLSINSNNALVNYNKKKMNNYSKRTNKLTKRGTKLTKHLNNNLKRLETNLTRIETNLTGNVSPSNTSNVDNLVQKAIINSMPSTSNGNPVRRSLSRKK